MDKWRLMERRIYNAVLEQFGGDKRAAIWHIQKKCSHYAKMSDRHFGTPSYAVWNEVYRVYRNVEFTLGYYIDLEDELKNEDMWGEE